MAREFKLQLYDTEQSRKAGAEANKLFPEDRAAHDWYRFVLSFPPHLVRDYLDRFSVSVNQKVLDPFCGTGTTLVECKKRGIASAGVEANPMVRFASQVKTDWKIDPFGLIEHSEKVAQSAQAELHSQGLDDISLSLFQTGHRPQFQLRGLSEETAKLLLTNSISPLPLHKTLVLIDHLKKNSDERFYRHQLLALAKAIVSSISNLHFGPEVGVGSAKEDAPVIASWLDCVRAMAEDLKRLQDRADTEAAVYQADSRQLLEVFEPASIDAVITSPPYPNEKDYTRTTRLESVLLGFIRNKEELKSLKRNLLRSNTRNVYKGDDDDERVSSFPEIQRIAEAIEKRRIEMGKTSGFERLYSRVTKLYFGGMARHLAELRRALRPGAHLAYVVGDQASYLRVMIRTGELLAQIAESLGYELLGIDLFRTRLATATKEQL
ncbi:MAG: DNA methyltransferase, partial [Acidobacteriota bacterium]